jgi:hypothetical protein
MASKKKLLWFLNLVFVAYTEEIIFVFKGGDHNSPNLLNYTKMRTLFNEDMYMNWREQYLDPEDKGKQITNAWNRFFYLSKGLLGQNIYMSMKGTNNKSVYSIKIELCFAKGYPENKYSASSWWCCKRDQAHALESRDQGW